MRTDPAVPAGTGEICNGVDRGPHTRRSDGVDRARTPAAASTQALTTNTQTLAASTQTLATSTQALADTEGGGVRA